MIKLPRPVQINHRIRTAAFAWCFVVVGLLLWERGAQPLAWGLAAAQFLLYPHLAWAHAALAREPRAAEMRNLFFDSALLGAWIAALGFPTWPAYAALFSSTLTSVVLRGWRGGAQAVAAFAGGALAWIAPMGLVYLPGAGAAVTLLCFSGSLAYTCGIGAVVYGQQQRLREARERRRESESRYRLITEHAGDLVAMVDRDARWLYTSPSYGRLFSAADLAAGGDALRNLHEEDQFRVRGALQVVMRSGESCRLRMRLHTTGGMVRRYETLVHPVRRDAEVGADGTHGAETEITGAVMASRDVTELRDREEQLEIAALAFDRMAEGMMITNAGGRILTVNQAFTRITGHQPEETLGRHESEIRSAMQPDAFYDDLYAEVLRVGRWEGTSWCRRRDGTLYREWRSVSAVRDAEQRVTHFVALFRELGAYGAAQDVHASPTRSA